MRLRPDDRKAIDLILDRAAAVGRGHGNGQVVYAAANVALRERVTGIESLLHLLDSWQAPEPPRDLVERTMDRIVHPSSERRHRYAQAQLSSAQHPPA